MAPLGFRDHNGMHLIEGVEQDATAVERGAEWYLDLDEMKLKNYPWRDGSGDCLTMVPVLGAARVVRPDGEPARNGLVEVPHGWRADLEGGALDRVVLRLMNLQGDKVPEALDDFLAPGLALILTYPAASVPTSGEWLAERIRFGGMAEDCNFAVEEDVSAEPGVTQPIWAPGSLVIASKTKRNNIGFRKCGTGKIAQVVCLAVGRNAQGITGYFFGTFRPVAGKPLEFDKVFDMDAVLADPSQTITKFGIGAPTSVHVSADVGWQTMGASGTDDGQAWLSQVLVSPLAGDCVALVAGLRADNTGVAWDVGFYTGTSGDSDTSIVQYNTITSDSAVSDSGGFWNSKTVAASAAPVTNGGSYRVIYDGGATDFAFDFPGGNPGHDRIVHTNNTPFPSPLGTTSSRTSTNSVYMTVETTTTPPTVNSVIASPSEVTAGTNISLIAGITDDDHTITEAEYYLGADPGEGNGVAMSLGAGTTSRTATATIDTTALLGPYTARVRGKDETDGWGATNFDTFTVNAVPAASKKVKVVGSSFKGLIQ